MRIVLAGAGHTHIEILRQGHLFRRAGHELTVISPESQHPYSGMGPGALGGSYLPDDILLPVAELSRRCGARFLRTSVSEIDPGASALTLETGTVLPYDVLSLNLGSENAVERKDGWKGPPVFFAKPVRRLLDARRELERRVSQGEPCRVAVVGSGPAGVELAGNAAFLLARVGGCAVPAGASVDLYAAPGARLAGLSGSREAYVARRLTAAGVRILRERKVDMERDSLEVTADVVLAAVGVRPPAVLRRTGLSLSDDGAVKVDRFLRALAYQNIFAVGDCAAFISPTTGHRLARVGVYAVRQQPVLLHNLLATAARMSAAGTESARGDAIPSARRASAGPESAGLVPFIGDGAYLVGLNLGFGRGIMYKGAWTITGRPAFVMKNALDRWFVRRYRGV